MTYIAIYNPLNNDTITLTTEEVDVSDAEGIVREATYFLAKNDYKTSDDNELVIAAFDNKEELKDFINDSYNRYFVEYLQSAYFQ